ncbi:MAG: VOC family protein [Thermodesulfobacteriota bacterium]
MEQEKVLKGTETEILQVGVVVKDLDKTVDFLTALGLGPFEISAATHPAARVKGKTRSYEVRLACSQQGPVQLELIEYQKGETIQKDFLDERGEGLHHILFAVNSLEETLDKFKAKGIEALQEDRFVGGGGLAYMGTDKVGGIILELIERPSDFSSVKGLKYKETWD